MVIAVRCRPTPLQDQRLQQQEVPLAAPDCGLACVYPFLLLPVAAPPQPSVLLLLWLPPLLLLHCVDCAAPVHLLHVPLLLLLVAETLVLLLLPLLQGSSCWAAGT
jgi:hypothetical protein